MASILQLKIQLLITEKLLYFANQAKNSERALELINVRSILKDTIIETQMREISILEKKLNQKSKDFFKVS